MGYASRLEQGATAIPELSLGKEVRITAPYAFSEVLSHRKYSFFYQTERVLEHQILDRTAHWS